MGKSVPASWMVLMLAGLAGGRAAACEYPANLVANCAMTTDLQSWASASLPLTHVTADGAPALGCAGHPALPPTVPGAPWYTRAYQCLSNVSAGTSYGYGLRHRIVAGLSFPSCTVNLYFYTGPNCSGGFLPSPSSLSFPAFPDWLSAATTVVAPAGATTVQLSISCATDSFGSFFELRFDSVFFGVDMTPVELVSFEIE